MTSIRRLMPGISSLFTRATSLEVSAPIRKEVAPPVEPVRTGFSDHSDFQPGVDDGTSLLSAHAPLLAGRPGAPLPEPLRSYTGESDFQARAPRYGYLLGTHVPPPGARPRQGQAAPGLRASSLFAEHTSRPSVSGASLEQAHALAGPEDQVLLYSGAEGLSGHSVVRHAEGRITDPSAPDAAYADTAAWERAHPGQGRPTVLSRDDVELVLNTPEGPARDELLAYFAPEDGAPVDRFEPSVALSNDSGFIADLRDLPLPPEPEELLSLLDASSNGNGFTVQEADAQPVLEDSEPSVEVAREALLAPPASEAPAGSVAPSPPSGVETAPAAWAPPERLDALGASESLDVARDVAARGSPEQQARVATALYARGQTPDLADAATYQRAAARAAAGSPEATQALLSQVGEANASAFVRAVLRDG